MVHDALLRHLCFLPGSGGSGREGEEPAAPGRPSLPPGPVCLGSYSWQRVFAQCISSPTLNFGCESSTSRPHGHPDRLSSLPARRPPPRASRPCSLDSFLTLSLVAPAPRFWAPFPSAAWLPAGLTSLVSAFLTTNTLVYIRHTGLASCLQTHSPRLQTRWGKLQAEPGDACALRGRRDVPGPACSVDDETAGIKGVTGSKRANRGEQRMSGALSAQVAQTGKSLPAVQETPGRSLGWEDALEEGMATHSRVLPGESHRQRSLVGYSPWGPKELDTIERLTLSLLHISPARLTCPTRSKYPERPEQIWGSSGL